jgi:hypothetical protein
MRSREIGMRVQHGWRALAWLGAVLLAMPVGAQTVVPVFECIEGGPTAFGAYFGYDSSFPDEQNIAVTPENNIFIGSGPVNPNLGQPTRFYSGTQARVFRAPMEFNEAPIYEWVLNGRRVRADIDATPCAAPPQQYVLSPFVDCVSPPGADGQARARLGYLSGEAVPLNLPARSTYNFFTGAFRLSDARAGRGQPGQFSPGVHHDALTVQFDPRVEPVLEWRLMGRAATVALGMPNVPMCADGARLDVFDNHQTAPINQAFARPLRVRVLDAAGQPVAGATVRFEGRSFMAAGFATPAGGLSATTVISDAQGMAETSAIANGFVGKHVVVATADTLGVSATFYLENTEGVVLRDGFED